MRWILHYPDAVPAEELDEWAEEFEDQDLKNLVHLIATHYASHGNLDVSIVLDQLEEECQKQELCALLLEEVECGETPPDRAFVEWRRTFRQQPLKRAREALKEKLSQDSADVLALQKQIMKIDQELETLK